MKEIAAAKAGRNFSAVLDEVERGAAIAVTRGGVRVAVISPVSRPNGPNGAEVLEVFRRWRDSGVADEMFADRVAEVREAADSGSGSA